MGRKEVDIILSIQRWLFVENLILRKKTQSKIWKVLIVIQTFKLDLRDFLEDELFGVFVETFLNRCFLAFEILLGKSQSP